jgi:holliday junction DNA helicase RuvA
MIERLEGEFLEIGPAHILVNLAGVGIRVSVPRTVAERLDGATRGVLWTRLLVRDGDPQLYGFLDIEGRAGFDALLGVSGVGPRIALAILSSMEPGVLALEAERGSIDQLVMISGVGKKLAGRIVLELKGKLPVSASSAERGSDDAGPFGDLAFDAVRALTALGYPVAESREAVQKTLRSHSGGAPPLDELLRQALIGLNRARP